MNKRSIIGNLLATGWALALLAVLEGESALSDPMAPGAPDDHDLARLWIAAQYHLKFVSRFGANSPPQIVDGKFLSSFPEEFERWIDAGAPGIAALELEGLASLLS